MSLIYDYLYISDQIIEQDEDIEVLQMLGIDNVTYLGDNTIQLSELRSNIFIGKVNSATIILGGNITCSWIESDFRSNEFLKTFYGSKIFGTYYDGRVMAVGFIIADGGKIIRTKDYYDDVKESGQKIDIEERIHFEMRKEVEQRTEKDDNFVEILEPFWTINTIRELEKMMIGKEFSEIKLHEIELRKYKIE